MDWILNNVAVGSWEDAADIELLRRRKIGAILNVRGDEDDSMKRKANDRETEYCALEKLSYLHLPLPDFTTANDDQLAQGIAFIEANVRLTRKVLVHCGAGWGRSPSFAAVYLLFCGESTDTDSAVARIQKKRKRCFTDGDDIHIDRIREFEKRLPDMKTQIDRLMKTFVNTLRIGMDPCPKE